MFETIRTYGGKPYALGRHLARLETSAQRVFISLPASVEELRKEVLRAVAAGRYEESYIRVMLTRGTAPMGLDPAAAERPLRVVIVAPLHLPERALYQRGVAVVTHRTRRTAEATPAEGAKIGNYLVNLIATREAKQAEAEEALLVDAGGRVVEGASSNVFALLRGELVTPPLEAGALPGITREGILRVAEARALPVRFSALSVEQLAAASEVFISSSIREIFPVVRVDGHPVADGRPGPVTLELLAAFRARALLDIEAEYPS